MTTGCVSIVLVTYFHSIILSIMMNSNSPSVTSIILLSIINFLIWNLILICMNVLHRTTLAKLTWIITIPVIRVIMFSIYLLIQNVPLKMVFLFCIWTHVVLIRIVILLKYSFQTWNILFQLLHCPKRGIKKTIQTWLIFQIILWLVYHAEVEKVAVLLYMFIVHSLLNLGKISP